MVNRLQKLGADLLCGRLKSRKAVEIASRLHPSLGRLVEKYLKPRQITIALLIAACSSVVDLHEFGKLTGAVKDDAITQQMLDETLKRHGELWKNMLKGGPEVKRNESAAPTSDQAIRGAAPKVDKDEHGQVAKKTRRLQQFEHRKSFGGSRTR
jgi:hypothetical protein